MKNFTLLIKKDYVQITAELECLVLISPVKSVPMAALIAIVMAVQSASEVMNNTR